MNDALFDELLHEEESSSLDFKRDQYPFAGATDEQKGELLKDILAFANAWRRTTAYILIGVDEVRGDRSIPVGVPHHLNDSDLQQFVNSKTNQPVTFAYQAYTFQGVQIGVIEIPVQSRPVYIRKAFGKLTPSTVYVRRGSSTDIASPDEIARIGAADHRSNQMQPAFELEWADLFRQSKLGVSTGLKSDILVPQLRVHELMAQSRGHGMFPPTSGLYAPDEDYYRRLITYAYDAKFLRPIGFCLKNTSSTAASNVIVKSRIERVDGVRLHDHHDRPRKPSMIPAMEAISSIQPLAEQLQARPDPIVREFPTHWELIIPFGNVLPRATVWSSNAVYLGSERDIVLAIPVELYAENLPDPQTLELNVSIMAEARAMAHADLPRTLD